MIGFALNRLVSLLASLLVASLVVFAAVEIVPGDPARFMLGINAQPDTVAALRAKAGHVDLSLRAGGGGKKPSDYEKGYCTIGDVVKQMAFALSTPFDSAESGGD